MSKQPRDDSNYPIPVLSYGYNRAQQISLGAASSLSSVISPSVRVVSLYSTADCFFEVCGDSGAANLLSSNFLPAGIYLDVSLGSDNNSTLINKYIAVISSTTGTLYLSERI